MSEHMPKEEAINHIVSSARYWSNDTIDNDSYPNNLGLAKAFKAAVFHVKNSHGAVLSDADIERAKRLLGLSPKKFQSGTLNEI